MKLNVVLLAGGKGTRIWPISNERTPKQFLKLPKLNKSSFQIALDHALKLTNPENIFITIASEQFAATKNQIDELTDHSLIKIIQEEKPLNTGKAIYDACNLIYKTNNHLTFFLPTDHSKYNNSLFEHLNYIDQTSITLFGQKTQDLSSCYGYIFAGEFLRSNYFEVKQFIEKPLDVQLLKEDNRLYFKNLGIYLAKPSIILKEFVTLYSRMNSIFNNSLSFDKMVSEKSSNLKCIIVDFKWQDLGSIETLHEFCMEEIIENSFLTCEEASKFNHENKFFAVIREKNGVRLIKTNGTRSQT